jgi:dTDP-4-amino-4,6-dideoxygalactose transaminase
MKGSISAPEQPSYAKSVYHVYVVRTAFRDDLQKYLNEAGIGTGIHYPVPIHLQNAYASIGWRKGDFPESEQAAGQILSLPMFAGLTIDQQKQVADQISQFAASYAAR